MAYNYDSIFGPDVVKIAVFGEPGCGKTTLIKAFHSQHSTGDVLTIGRAKVYSCQFMANNEMRKAVIYEFFGYLDTIDLVAALEEYYITGIVLMHSIDDPMSFQMVTDKYIPVIRQWQNFYLSQSAVVLVGSKADLRYNQLVIESCAQENESPVTSVAGESLRGVYIDKSFECSTDNLENMYTAVKFILDLSLSCLNEEMKMLPKKRMIV